MQQRRGRSYGLVLGGALAFIGCTGSGGGLEGAIDTDMPARKTQDAPPRSTEPAQSSVENVARSLDPAPGTAVSTGASSSTLGNCAGIYSCLEQGKTQSRTVTTNAAGNCVYDGVEAQPDGRLVYNGATVGTWSGDPTNGVTLSVPGQTAIVCTKLTTGTQSR
jgi:hypothetical protein